MFEKIRKPFRGKNIFSFIVFSIICVVFVLIGVPIGQMSSLGGAVASVNNKVISWAEYQNYLEMLQNRPSSSALDSNMEAKRQIQLKQEAITTLINTELVNQSAHNAGVLVSDQVVRDRIVQIPIFKEDGRFVRSRYYAFLENNRWSASFFEKKIKKEIQALRFQNFFNKSAGIAQIEENHNNELALFKVQVSYVMFRSHTLDKKVFSALKQHVENRDMGALGQIISLQNWKWEQVPEFDLSRLSLTSDSSITDDERLFGEIIAYLPQTGIVNKILRIRDRSFLVKINKFYQKPPARKALKSDAFAMFTRRLAGRILFMACLQQVRSVSKIKINPRLQQSLSPL